MGKASPIRDNMSSGVLSPWLQGNVSVPQYAKALSNASNFIAMFEGPCQFRNPFQLVSQSANNNKQYLVGFIFSETVQYTLAFSDNSLTIYDRAGTVIQTIMNTGYLQSDLVDDVGRYRLSTYQIADVMWIASGTQPVRILTRTSATTFTLIVNPFFSSDGTTVSTNRGPFDAFDAVNNPNTFDATRGYPENVTVFRERMLLTRGLDWFVSRVGRFENFMRVTGAGDSVTNQITAETGFNGRVEGEQINRIEWAKSYAERVVFGTQQSIQILSTSNNQSGFQNGNAKTSPGPRRGSISIKPILTSDRLIYNYKSGDRLTELNFDGQRFTPLDLTKLGASVVNQQIIGMAYQEDPTGQIFVIFKDGRFATCTYDTDTNVVAWMPHRSQFLIDSVAVLRNPTDPSAQDVWISARNPITNVSYVMVQRNSASINYPTNSPIFADGWKAVAANEVNASGLVSNVGHLNGLTASVLVNGSLHPPVVVSNGTFRLDLNHYTPGDIVHVGAAYTGFFTTTRMEGVGAQDGTSIAKTKRIHNTSVLLWQTLGGGLRGLEGTTEYFEYRAPSGLMDTKIPLYSGFVLTPNPDGYNTEGTVTVFQDQPFPMTVLSIEPQLEVQDRS
jgi:hypothetical protein